MVARLTLLAYLFVVALATTSGLPFGGAAPADVTMAALDRADDAAGDDTDTLAVDVDADDDLDDAIADDDSDASDDDAIPPAARDLVTPDGSMRLHASALARPASPSLASLFRPPCTASV